MKRARIQLIKTTCPRCGKEVYTTNRSITGATATHAKYAGICSNCTTDEEKNEMLYSIAGAILSTTAKGGQQ